MKTLKNLNLYTTDGIIKNGHITFADQIISIGTGEVEGIDMKGRLLIPGFIDQHIHGVAGADVMDASAKALAMLKHELPKEGTTAFLATTMTEEDEAILAACNTVDRFLNDGDQHGAELLGIHLEGPFISPVYKGAQREDAIINPSVERFNAYQEAAGGHIRHVTMAPERPGADQLLAHLVKTNVTVSIGHSDADDKTVESALARGAGCFTHGYNAMSRIHHRNLGVAGMMLLDDLAYAEIIPDLIHTNAQAIRLLYKTKTADKMIIVTDAMRAKGLADGRYALGGQDVTVSQGEARLADGTLAGSVLKMIDGVKHVKNVTGCAIEDLIKMASLNPARLHGITDRKGQIKVGLDADFLIVDEDLNLYETWCKGVRCA
ncbi:MAG: N-acetylglucosamine-6-phosphate deacetylase [Acholeplasmataceae bacterium]|nr:MAG: N-acetylglucosamine-6-phosphate deacetylase [Acholeplasmataceae bacterium]